MPPTPVAAPVDMNGTCLFYAKKKEVCCSDTTLSQIAGTVATAKVAISDAVAILKDEKKFANEKKVASPRIIRKIEQFFGK